MLKRSRVLSVCFLLSAWALLTSADAYGQSAVLKELAQKEARYLVAASIDRYLSFTQGFQKYGTNRVSNQKTGKEELVPIDRNTPDSERAKYGVPPLAELLKTSPEQTPQKARQKKASATGSPFRMRVFPPAAGVVGYFGFSPARSASASCSIRSSRE